jgi:nitroreductase
MSSKRYTDGGRYARTAQTPALILICGPRGNNEAAFDWCRAGQNLTLAAHVRGLGSCWLGAPLPWLTSPGIAKELGVPPDFDPIEC